jgi:hypothetical protein
MVDQDNIIHCSKAGHCWRKWFVGAVLFTTVGLGLYGFIQHAQQKLLVQFDQLVKMQAEHGLIISYQSKTLKGMPWKMHLMLRDVRLQGQSVVGWHAHNPGDVTLSYSPLQSERLSVQTVAPFLIHFDLSQLPSITIGQANGEVSVTDPFKGHALELHDVALKRDNEEFLQMKRVGIESTAVKAEPNSDKLLEGLKVEMEAIKGPAIPFDQIKKLTARLAFRGILKPGSLPQMMQSWMDAGGSIELSELMVKADKLEISSQGTLSLDEKLQPLATFTAEVNGVPETIDELTKRKAISPTLARVYKMAFAMALMASQSQDFKIAFEGKTSNDKALKLSLTLQDGSVSVGSTEIINFPKIDWERLKMSP